MEDLLPVVVFNVTIVIGVTVTFPTFVSGETLGKVSFVCNRSNVNIRIQLAQLSNIATNVFFLSDIASRGAVLQLIHTKASGYKTV